MRTRFVAALPLLALASFALAMFNVPAAAQMYRWVDDSGKVHYSDRAPAAGAKNVQKQSAPAAPGAAAGLPYALQQAAKSFPVTLYSSDVCKDSCARARELLNKRGVPYREISVVDEADFAQLKQLSGGSAVPVMTVGRELYQGFESGMYKAALDAAGYPASSQLPPGVQARQPVAKPERKAAPSAAETEGSPPNASQEAAGAPNTPK